MAFRDNLEAARARLAALEGERETLVERERTGTAERDDLLARHSARRSRTGLLAQVGDGFWTRFALSAVLSPTLVWSVIAAYAWLGSSDSRPLTVEQDGQTAQHFASVQCRRLGDEYQLTTTEWESSGWGFRVWRADPHRGWNMELISRSGAALPLRVAWCERLDVVVSLPGTIARVDVDCRLQQQVRVIGKLEDLECAP